MRESMDKTVENILLLMQKQNTTANKMQIECELSNSAVTEWKKGKAKPSLNNLVKIADYFGVSVDYLLGREETPALSEQEKTLLKVFRQSEERDKNLALGYLTGRALGEMELQRPIIYRLSEDEKRLIDAYRNTPKELQNRIMGYAEAKAEEINPKH